MSPGSTSTSLDLAASTQLEHARPSACHGASTRSEPSSPTASSRWRDATRNAASNCARTSSAKRSVPVEAEVDAGRAERLLAVHAHGLAGEEARPADAVAADVHQRAAVELGHGAARSSVLSRAKPNVARIEPSSPIAPSATSSGTRAVCGWWRYMNASISTRPDALGDVEGLLHVRRARASTASRRGRACPPRARASSTRGGAVRERHVDRVHLGIREERLVRAVRAREPVLAGVGLGARLLAARPPPRRPPCPSSPPRRGSRR